jgi:Ca-activated chloride channel family protein
VIFAIDVSRSMLARDCPPNRLAFAARFAQGLVERMERSAVGVAVFKGEAHLAVPLTQDRRAIAALLENLSPSLMSAGGSNPAQSVRLCLDSFPPNQSGARAIVLLTDGDGTAGDLDSAARDCARRGVTLIVAGVGTEAGESIDIMDSDGSDATYRTRLAETALKQAARSAGGKSLYVSVMERGSAFLALELLQSLASADGAQSYASRPVDRSWRFVLGAVALFCLAFAVSSTRVSSEDSL